MKRKRWAFVAVVVAIGLVAPAAGQGKAGSAPLRWSLVSGRKTIKSYNFGAHAYGSRVTRRFRLLSSTNSGKLAIQLYGTAYSLASDRCTGKSIGHGVSCLISVAYEPSETAGDVGRVWATARKDASVGINLSGSCIAGAPSQGHVYWSTGYAVQAIPLAGGCVSTLAHTHDGDLGPVAVDAQRVYWAKSLPGTVQAAHLDGSGLTTLASGQNGPRSLVVDGTNAYWADLGDGTVKSVPLDGGSVTTLASGQDHPAAVAVDGTNVYWVNQGTDCCVATGTVNEVSVGGGGVTTLATGQFFPSSVAADGKNVYWVDSAAGTVNEVAAGGGSVTALASGQDGPAAVAVDATHVYWVTANFYCADGLTDKLSEVPLGGGSVTTLASGLNLCPNSVALGP